MPRSGGWVRADLIIGGINFGLNFLYVAPDFLIEFRYLNQQGSRRGTTWVSARRTRETLAFFSVLQSSYVAGPSRHSNDWVQEVCKQHYDGINLSSRSLIPDNLHLRTHSKDCQRYPAQKNRCRPEARFQQR